VDERPVERTVLITGGASGMGLATAERYAAGGWRVALVDRDAEALEQAVGALGGGSLARSWVADVRDVGALTGAIQAAAAWRGRLDVVVAAAGVWSEGSVEELTEVEFDRVVGVNVKGVVFTARAAVPALRASRGAFLVIASDAGIQANRGAALYCASKGAVVLFAKTLALDLAPAGVRVNAVCPGDVLTPMLAGQARDHGGDDPDGYLRRLLAAYPQGDAARFIEPAEVAELLWFLGQPAARSITGAAVSIDQGLSAGIW
jgi:NAD(P)-dependent dehydrogenase (short-subunit alcohol dehydrogenase family)